MADARCNLTDPRIDESSGVASASWSDDVVFTHNDSGDEARFFALDTHTCATRATYVVSGATNVDWEDMARGAASDGASVVWLGDIGDNNARRSTIVIYEVAEPGPSSAGGPVPARARWTLTYPDGAHNAETLLVDPETGRPVVVTKDATAGRSRAYRVPPGGSGVLEPLASLAVQALPGGNIVGPAWQVTGGATSPDRRSVVIRSYLAAWLWTASPGEPLAAVLARPPRRIDVPLTRQPEAVAFTRDGAGLWLTSEGVGTPLHHEALDGSSAGGSPAAGVPSTSAAVAGHGPVRRPTSILAPALTGAGTVILAAALTLLVRRVARRRG